MDTSLFQIDTNTLIIAVIAGAFWMGYFAYGKKQQMVVPMLSGIALCVYPYFTNNIWILCIVGIVLIAIPFILKF